MTDEEGPPPVEAGDSAILENAQPEQIHSPKPSQPTLNKDTTTKDSPLEQQQRPQTNSASPAHSPPSKSRSRRSQSRSRDQDHRRRKSRSRSRSRERRSRSRERRRRRDHRDDDRDRDGKQQHSRRRSSRSRERSDRDHHRHKSSRRRSRSRDGDRRRRWRSRSRSRDRNRRHRHRRRSYSRSTSRSRSRSRGAPMYTAPAPLPSATAAAAAASLAAQLFPNMTSGMFPLSNTLPNLTSSSQFPNMTAAAALTAMNASASRPSVRLFEFMYILFGLLFTFFFKKTFNRHNFTLIRFFSFPLLLHFPLLSSPPLYFQKTNQLSPSFLSFFFSSFFDVLPPCITFAIFSRKPTILLINHHYFHADCCSWATRDACATSSNSISSTALRRRHPHSLV